MNKPAPNKVLVRTQTTLRFVCAEYRKTFPHDDFFLFPGQSITKIAKQNGVSELYGIYVISECRKSETILSYMGKAGSLQQDGQFKEQGIRKRLSAKQGGMTRKQFFIGKMANPKVTSLHFEWFETYGSNSKVVPALIEAELLLEYFLSHNMLPQWNKTL